MPGSCNMHTRKSAHDLGRQTYQRCQVSRILGQTAITFCAKRGTCQASTLSTAVRVPTMSSEVRREDLLADHWAVVGSVRRGAAPGSVNSGVAPAEVVVVLRLGEENGVLPGPARHRRVCVASRDYLRTAEWVQPLGSTSNQSSSGEG